MSKRFCTFLLLLLVAPTAHAQAVKCSAFMHNTDGSWRSFGNATVIGSHGPITVETGEVFRKTMPGDKADIAKILDAICQ